MRIPRSLLALNLLLLTGAGFAQSPDGGEVTLDTGRSSPIPLQHFSQAEADIDVDGLMDEAIWSRVNTSEEMRVIVPDTLDPISHQTDVRIFYTDRGIYFGFDMEQPADTLVQRISTRDNLALNRDKVGLTIDTSGEGLFGYWMMLALGDNQLDGTILPERQYNSDWDGAWYGGTSVTDKGWSAEFYIPWGQMAMPLIDEVRQMGVYVERDVAYLDQVWAWPHIVRSDSIFMADLPLLELEGIDPRQQWSVFPYISSTFDNIDNKSDSETGFDLFWRPTSNFQMTATVNPDFASVELDNVVVNLTANETFYPEKRLFFQEGQEIFNTTPRSTGRNGKRLAIVNTRRIGGRPRRLDLPSGVRLPTRQRIRPADLDGALKVTGQSGAVRYGLLAATEDDTEYRIDDERFFQHGRDFTTFRMIYEDNKGAAYRGLGYIGSFVDHPDSVAEVHAVDFHYLTTGGKFNVDGQLISSDSDDHGAGQGMFADLIYSPSQGISHTVQLTYFDDKLDVNDFGFQSRNNNRELWYRFEWIKSDLSWARNFRFNPYLRYEENSEGDRTNNMLPTMSMNITLNNLDRISLSMQHFPKRYDDRNSFGNGTFEVAERTSYSAGYTTNTAEEISYNVRYGSAAELAGGRNNSISTGITWRPGDKVNLSGTVTYNDRDAWLLHQQGQEFTAFETSQLRTNINLDYFVTAKQQFRMVMQWVGIEAEERYFYHLGSDLPTKHRDLTKVSKPAGPSDSFSISQLNFRLRYRWQIAPLSDLFIVYSRGDNRRTLLSDFDDLFENSWDNPLGDQLTVKLRYRFGT